MKNKKLITLICCMFTLACVIGMKADALNGLKANTEGECWYYMNIAHEGAEIARKIGGDNEQVLAYYGKAWTDYNNLRKELVAQKQEEARRAEEEKKANMVLWKSPAQVTAYEWTGSPCANGRYPTVGYTVACNTLPIGTRVYIDGVGERVVEDRGATWHPENWMDLYLGDTASCNAWGIQYRNVYLVR